MQHTPAPWKIDNQNITTEDYMIIANLPRQIHDRGTIAGENECQEKIANAKLIAAAPELLEALESIISDVGVHIPVAQIEGTPEYKRYTLARAAIKKARGE